MKHKRERSDDIYSSDSKIDQTPFIVPVTIQEEVRISKSDLRPEKLRYETYKEETPRHLSYLNQDLSQE